jgi:hypothetical protein
MKILNYLFIYLLMVVITASCNKGLDPITPISPKADEDVPEIVIEFPTEGKVIRSTEEIGTAIFELVASDDIELKSVIVQLDGTEIGNYSSFKDYRKAAINLEYNNLLDGTHTLTATVTDLTGKSAAATVNFKKITAPVYVPLDGEILYLPFEDEFLEIISGEVISPVGAPGFAEGKVGSAYAGATDAYLSFPTTEIIKTANISATFWMKINTTPDRAGILTVSREDLANAGYPAIQNNRTSGFRFFREGSATSQQFKVNVGLGGTNESWNDGGSIDPSTGEWVHLAFTISDTASTIYINGEVARVAAMLNPIDWTGCDQISIMTGVPRFTEWNHFSDLSLLDELHIFNRVITAAEVQSLYTVE